MTRREDQAQQVVVDVVGERAVEVRLDARFLGRQDPADLRVLLRQLGVAAEGVDRAPFRHRHQPGTGIARHALARPLL